MSKKKQKNDNFDENEESVPVESDSQMAEPTASEVETNDVNFESEGETEERPSETDSGNELEMEDEMSPDDLLGDVRRSLIMDSAEKDEVEQSKWWKRIGKGGKNKQDVNEAQQLEIVDPQAIEEMVRPTIEQGEHTEQIIDDLIDLLEDDTLNDSVSEREEDVVLVDENADLHAEADVVDLKELKRRAFSAGSTGTDERSLSEVRSIALDGSEEVFVEVETKIENPTRERLKELENALMPYRRYFYFGFIFISLVMVFVVSVSLYRLWLSQQPAPIVEEVVLLPYPVQIILPGDFRFNLGKGSLQPDGRWEPVGPEWLEGTEVCRWIAIPHNRQLEAIVRTFTQEDQIELVMSNNDQLTYTVYSINQLSIEEMQKLDASTPCMLLVLAQPGADERWVVTAIP